MAIRKSEPSPVREAIEVDLQSGTPRVEAIEYNNDDDDQAAGMNIEVESQMSSQRGMLVERITCAPMESIPEDEGILAAIINYFLPDTDSEAVASVPPPTTKSILRTKKDADQGPVQRNVSFSSLEIREYKMTLGDHPNAKSGPPTSLDWEYKPNPEIVDLDKYERNRCPRRHKNRLRISIRDREQLLVKEAGFSYTEVKDAWMKALEVRKNRLDTIRRSPAAEMMDEVWESANRKFWRLFGWNNLG